MYPKQYQIHNKNRYKVVLIDDSGADQLLYSRIFSTSQTADFTVFEYSSVKSFQLNLKQLREHEPDLIIADILSTKEPPDKFLHNIMHGLPNVPIVATAELLSEEFVTYLADMGVTNVLEKNTLSDNQLIHTALHSIRHFQKLKDNLVKANHDVLTGLANRGVMEDRANHAISLSRRTNKTLALMLIDLDDFKCVNDNYGHDFGDIYLQNISKRLKDCVRVTDTVARMGGDEFAILLEGLEYPEMTVQIAKKILTNVTEPINIRTSTITPSLSIGISMLSNDNTGRFSYDWLMQSADKALYEAKSKGKNTFSVFTDAQDSAMLKALELEDAVLGALANREFCLHYQPIFDAVKNQITGFESLIRWRKSDGSLAMPGQFLPTIEKLGNMKELGDIVIEDCLKQYAKWRKQGMAPLKMHINVSPAQFLSDGFYSNLKKYIDQYSIPAECIELELTEQNLFNNSKYIEREFSKMDWLGVKVAIDDFGTGYSSFDYIRRFKIDTVKLDRTFIRKMFDNPVDMAIVQAITNFSKDLGINIIAEGVENREQWDHLLSLGVDQMQGFYRGKPMSAENFQKRFCSPGKNASYRTSPPYYSSNLIN